MTVNGSTIQIVWKTATPLLAASTLVFPQPNISFLGLA